MVAMIVSLPVFFVLSGQRLRGLFALVPVAGALWVTLPGLHEVYLAFVSEESAVTALEEVLPTVWLTAAGAGLYAALWGLIDKRWRPPKRVTRVIGGAALATTVALFVFGATAVSESVGNPVS